MDIFRFMDTQRISKIIFQAYGRRYNLVPRYEPKLPVWTRIERQLRALLPVTYDARVRFFVATGVVALLGVSIYYFNTILAAEHVMLKSNAQVEVLLQRRNDLSVNLAKAVQDYSIYERQVLAEVVRLRGDLSLENAKGDRLNDLTKISRKAVSAPQAQVVSTTATSGTPPLPDTAASTITGLLATAEQYPDLKLAANFQNLMAALVEVEKDLASERLKFNDAVMVYWEYVSRVPSSLFAKIFRFKNPTYFKATEEARTLKAISY